MDLSLIIKDRRLSQKRVATGIYSQVFDRHVSHFESGITRDLQGGTGLELIP